jgi:hypothetical protein
MIEQDRAAAIQERDQLKHLLLEKKRNEAMWRSRTDIESTEQLLEQRSRAQLLRSSQEDVEAQIQVREDVFRSLQKGLFAQSQRAAGLERDIAAVNEDISAQDSRNNAKSETIGEIEQKCEDLCRQLKYLKDSELGNFVPSKDFQGTESMNSMKYLQVTSVQLEKELLKQRKAQVRLDVRCRALQKYMELILKINEDLTQMLMQKAHAQAEILEIADGFSSRHKGNMRGGAHFSSASPERVIPTYDEILHVIKEEHAGSSPNLRSTARVSARSRSRSPNKQKRATTPSRAISVERDSVTEIDSVTSSIQSSDSRRPRRKTASPRKGSLAKSTKLMYNVQRSHREHDLSGRIPVDRNRVHHPTSAVSYGARTAPRGIKQKVAYAVRNRSTEASYLKPTVTALYSQHHSLWDEQHPTRVDGVLLQRNSFIPSSSHPHKIELNLIAKESKTNKAVKELNATIASRVKSVYKQM